ncbi:PREDICTED: uncharacterized protein LOC109168431 [Ipomoea nil]|uniref:uncharacterized protein LOC109168431 n=1 Tax=Ipomoea nil TaxID=35883 RepID=UPI0009010F66|nr:PREDICTED: uncharacterized protein LOC109168431 [Ipomoea nil]
MAKAYDRMEWGFLEGMLLALGFTRGWVDLVLVCVSSVRYNVMVNGEAAGTRKESQGLLHGVKVARGAPPVSHLFFANDSLLFFKATDVEAQAVRECLDRYGQALGQLVNFDKSSIMYSTNTMSGVRDRVGASFGVQEVEGFGRYLGLPSFLGRNRTSVFRYIEQKVRERVSSWQKKLLSRVGKEVLLKSVAQAMPILSMSVFLLPTVICASIENMMNRFWWQHGGATRRGLHWLSWRCMALPKSCGSMGFKRLREFNVALLAKQVWRILTAPESLTTRVLKARYFFPNDCFLKARLGSNPSYIWRSILAGQDLLRKGVVRRVGDGADTLI